MAKSTTTKSLTDGFATRQKSLTGEKSKYRSLPVDDNKKRRVTFSLLFFSQIQNFGITGKDSNWFSGLLEQLKVISDKEFDDLIGNPAMKKYFRLHTLEFGASVSSALTKDDFNFIPDEFRPKGDDCKYWQFQISKANGRVIGFFNEDNTIFYIVFLDPNHNAQLCDYSDYKVRPIEPAISEIDDLHAKITRLIETDRSLEAQCADILYQGNNIYMCMDRELFDPFDKYMKDGSLQARFQEFLISQL